MLALANKSTSTSAVLAFKSKASWVFLDIGLFKSAVLSTLFKPTSCLFKSNWDFIIFPNSSNPATPSAIFFDQQI